MPKPKSELTDIKSVCNAIHARGSLACIDDEINYHLSEIERIRGEIAQNVSFKAFQGLSPSKILELSELMSGHFWCVEQYNEALEKINEKFFNTQEN